MNPPAGLTRRRVLIGLLLAVGASALADWAARGWSRPRDLTAVPLARSAYLRDVVEPITIEECMNFDDGGSIGVIFRDARRRRYGACLESDWGAPDGDGGDGMTLALGSMWPGGGRRVPVRGPEEQAFAGLLQRWSRSGPEGRAWVDRIERRDWTRRFDPKAPLLTGHETPDQLANGHAVGLLRSLLRRY